MTTIHLVPGKGVMVSMAEYEQLEAELTAVREERDRLRKALLALLDALKAPVRPVRSHKDD